MQYLQQQTFQTTLQITMGSFLTSLAFLILGCHVSMSPRSNHNSLRLLSVIDNFRWTLYWHLDMYNLRPGQMQPCLESILKKKKNMEEKVFLPRILMFLFFWFGGGCFSKNKMGKFQIGKDDFFWVYIICIYILHIYIYILYTHVKYICVYIYPAILGMEMLLKKSLQTRGAVWQFGRKSAWVHWEPAVSGITTSWSEKKPGSLHWNK